MTAAGNDGEGRLRRRCEELDVSGRKLDSEDGILVALSGVSGGPTHAKRRFNYLQPVDGALDVTQATQETVSLHEVDGGHESSVLPN